MKKIIAILCIGTLITGLLAGCGIWADEEAPTETTEIVYVQ
ncbi:MAG: hypothetical protein ACI3XA_03780 [Clostridia bacterium]